jgi:tRNA threonylcarbamoyladenosine biosynthesis protein TsaB
MEQTWRTRDNHTVELLPYIVLACEQQGLTPSALTAVAVSIGPGSFTGLRVGLSAAKGLALALDIRLLGIPTLDAIAYAHSREQLPVCALLQAGRRRLCVAFYQTTEDRWQRTDDCMLTSPEDLITSFRQPTLVCGEIDQDLAESLRNTSPPQVVVANPAFSLRRAGYLAELAWKRFLTGQHDDPASLKPIYLHHG